MRNKQLNSNLSGSISKGGVLYRAGEIPTLTKDQLQQAKLVNQLPQDFPFANWENMTTKQQLQQMKYSGLNAQDQWTLLNANVPLAVLNDHNQAQNEIETKDFATRIAAALMDTAAQAAAAKAQAAGEKPTVSTSLQNGSLRQNMDLKQQLVKNIGSASACVGAAAAPADTANAPTGIKPVVNDSRDAMEQKKDRAWDKIESAYNPRDAMDRKKDEMWGQVNGNPLTYPVDPSATPLPQPGPSPNPTTTPNPNTPKSNNDRNAANYNWYSSYDEAVNAWAKSFWRLSKDFEHCALIYKKVDENGNEVYTFGETRIGSQGLPPVFQPNVAESYANLYINEKITDASRVGFVHSHPEPPDGYTVGSFSFWDLALKILPGIDYVTLVPYENEDAEPITK